VPAEVESERVREKNKFILYRDLKDGYRGGCAFPYGRDAYHFAARIPGEAACEDELRAFMVYYLGAEVLHTTG
jgi:hypothetical protein